MRMTTGRLRVSVATPDQRSGRSTAGAAPAAALRGLGPWLARVAPAKARGDLSIAIVSDRRMRALNRQFRGKDYVTDVLSFPSGERGFMGDIVIAAGVLRRQAREAGHSVTTELRVLSLHGLLHLLGYDHEADDGKMARVETTLRKRAGLPAGLIERTRPATRARRAR